MPVTMLDLQLIYGVAGAREQFERLCSHLIRTEYPDAQGVRVQQGDGGIDAYTGGWGDGSLRVFQVKYFPAGIKSPQRTQVRDSFLQDATHPRFTTEHWTLCLPIDLGVDEAAWFAELHAEGRESGIMVDLWGAVALERLLYKPENVGALARFFNQDYLTQIGEMHGMLLELVRDLPRRLTGTARRDALLHGDQYVRACREVAASQLRALGEKQISIRRFDVGTGQSLAPSIVGPHPVFSGALMDLLGSLGSANDLIAHILDLQRSPRYPSGFWNRDGISEREIEEAPRKFVEDAMAQLSAHLETDVMARLDDFGTKMALAIKEGLAPE